MWHRVSISRAVHAAPRRSALAAALLVASGLSACSNFGDAAGGGSVRGQAIVAGIAPRDGTPAERAAGDRRTERALRENAREIRRLDAEKQAGLGQNPYDPTQRESSGGGDGGY